MQTIEVKHLAIE